MNRPYVSEFARFMDSYLQGHPEVVEDQHAGFDIYWKQQGPSLPVADSRKAQSAKRHHASRIARLLHAAERNVA